MEKELAYLRKHKNTLNITLIAKYVGYSPSSFRYWVDNKEDSKGYIPKLPEKCYPKLKAFIKDLLEF